MKALPVDKVLNYCKNFVAKKGGYMYREQFDGVYVKADTVFATDTFSMIACKTCSEVPTQFIPVGDNVGDRGYIMPAYERLMPNLQDALAVKTIRNEDGLMTYWKDVFTLQERLLKKEKDPHCTCIRLRLTSNAGLSSYAKTSEGTLINAIIHPIDSINAYEDGLEMSFNPRYLVNICKVLASVNPCEIILAFVKNGLYIETEEQMIRWYCCRMRTPEEMM